MNNKDKNIAQIDLEEYKMQMEHSRQKEEYQNSEDAVLQTLFVNNFSHDDYLAAQVDIW